MFRFGHLVVALSEAWLVPVFLIFLRKTISGNLLRFTDISLTNQLADSQLADKTTR